MQLLTLAAYYHVQVGVLNFNPYFKPPDENGVPFVSKTYASDIVNILYPEDILASEIEKSSDVRAMFITVSRQKKCIMASVRHYYQY